MTAREGMSIAPVLEAAGDLLRVLGAPVRIAIVNQLRAGPRQVHQIVQAVGVASQPTISGHLRVLRAANVVSRQRRGRDIVYRLNDELIGRIVAAAIGYASESRPAARSS